MKETQLNKTQNVSSGINFKSLSKEMAVKERKKKKKSYAKNHLKHTPINILSRKCVHLT